MGGRGDSQDGSRSNPTSKAVQRTVLEQSLLSTALLVPLRHLALKVFAGVGSSSTVSAGGARSGGAASAGESLPPDFVPTATATIAMLYSCIPVLLCTVLCDWMIQLTTTPVLPLPLHAACVVMDL